ncbi:MAG: hypothetical protein ACFFCT_05695 [Candidatus Odinarchaeota archaeon]
MGRIKKDEKNKVTDACRVPPGLSHHSWFAATVNKLKKQDGAPDTSGIDLQIFATFMIILLFFIPLWNAPYSLGTSIQITQGEEIDWNNGFEIDVMPYVGQNETLLLNSTPDDSSPIWDTGSYYANTKTSSNGDGYTISVSSAINNPGFFSCVTTASISIPDIKELYFNVILNGIEGSCNVTLSVDFTVVSLEISWVNLFESSITGRLNQGESLNLTLSTPVALLKTISPSWISNVAMNIMIHGTPSATLIIKESVIKAISDKPLYPVTIDATATTGESLHSSYLTRYLSNPPVLVLNRTGVYGSPAILLDRANYTIFLPQNQYSSAAGWFKYSAESNPIIDALIVPFEIIPDERIRLLLRMRTLRFDINCNAPIPFRAMHVHWSGDYGRLLNTPFTYYPWPDRLYLPPIEGDIELHVLFEDWHLQASIVPSTGHKYTLSFYSPLTMNVFGLLLNLGQIIDVVLVVLILLLVMKRWFVKSVQISRKAVLFDHRFVPLALLMSSFLFPWVQYSEWGGYLTSYFPILPVRILSLQGNITFSITSFGDWLILGLMSLVMLWAPLVSLLFLISTPESKSNNRKTTKLLSLPFLYAAFYLIGAFLSGFPIALGTILAMLGLLIWLFQKAIIRVTRFTDASLSSDKKEGGA